MDAPIIGGLLLCIEVLKSEIPEIPKLKWLWSRPRSQILHGYRDHVQRTAGCSHLREVLWLSSFFQDRSRSPGVHCEYPPCAPKLPTISLKAGSSVRSWKVCDHMRLHDKRAETTTIKQSQFIGNMHSVTSAHQMSRPHIAPLFVARGPTPHRGRSSKH